MFRLSRQYNWLIHSIIYRELKKSFSKHISGVLVDIGCGNKPYARLASQYIDQHIGIDHPGSMHSGSNIDILSTAYNIPLKNEYCDSILCTDVLEHIEEPSAALMEASRILKPGGVAIYTVPLFWHLHEEPRDFYRYTKYGLSYLFEKNNFRIVGIKPLTGFICTFSQELVYYLYRLRKGGPLNPFWWIVPIIGAIVQLFAFALNPIDRSSRFTAEYLVVAKKI